MSHASEKLMNRGSEIRRSEFQRVMFALLTVVYRGMEVVGVDVNLKTNRMNITLDHASAAVDAAKNKAKELGVPMNIAVVDRGSNLLAFVRMDGAWLGSKDIAIKKAQTANYFDMDSEKIGELSQPGKPLYGIEVSNGGLISFGGGVLLKDAKGVIIGAIGVSGGQVDQDIKVARAGASALVK